MQVNFQLLFVYVAVHWLLRRWCCCWCCFVVMLLLRFVTIDMHKNRNCWVIFTCCSPYSPSPSVSYEGPQTTKSRDRLGCDTLEEMADKQQFFQVCCIACFCGNYFWRLDQYSNFHLKYDFLFPLRVKEYSRKKKNIGGL